MEKHQFVSIIMPVRNEAKTIRQTVDSILKQDYPADNFEIIIADGISTDGTDEIIISLEKENPAIQYLKNFKKIVPTGLNMAIRKAKGDVIVRLDAHTIYPKNYISRLTKALKNTEADNVGCIIETIPANETKEAHAIAMGLSSQFGVGNSKFRVGIHKATEVDTVPFGCFRREVFDEIGYFDEELVRNQDDEFNARMIKHGYRIVLIPDLTCHYHARENFSQLARMLYQYGLFKPLVNKKLRRISSWRQLVPLCLVVYIIAGGIISTLHPITLSAYLSGICIYILFILLGSIKAITKNTSNFLLLPYCILTFMVMHLSYGSGYLTGLWKFIVNPVDNPTEFKLSR
ncbi:MAG: glycosyltransferase family 2 protein [Bacteroidales bacterium]|nr:glycosyltransferase family 2 protein [Bacteroidales bacterium]